MPVASCIPFPLPAPCDAMLIMLVCATCWLSLHLYMLAYMSMHKSYLLVCCPYFNAMKLWTSDLNLHFSLVDTTFCLFACFLIRLCISLALSPVTFYACHVYYVYPLYAFSYALCILSFPCLSVGFLSLPLHVHTWSEDVWSKGTVSQAQAKRAWVQACRYNPSGCS